MKPTYVYRPVVTRWPDWCPDGWDRAYSDYDRYSPDPEDYDSTQEPPDVLRALLDSGSLPDDLPHHRAQYPDETLMWGWHIVLLPRRDRVHWLSAPAVHRWVRHARALGAEAHVERGAVTEWEALS